MQKIILFLFSITILIPGAITALVLSGDEIQLKWSNTSSQIAVLTKDNAGQYLRIIDAQNEKILKNITLPVQANISCFDWKCNDDGFLFAVEEEFQYHEIQTYDLQSGKVNKILTNYIPVYAGIMQIETMQGNRWAAAFYGEGDSDMAVYENEKTLIETGTYPSGISIIGWKNGFMYVETSFPLEYGLNRIETEKSFSNKGITFDYFNELPASIYKVDVDKKTAVKEKVNPDDITDVSFNGKYRMKFTELKKGPHGHFDIQFIKQ